MKGQLVPVTELPATVWTPEGLVSSVSVSHVFYQVCVVAEELPADTANAFLHVENVAPPSSSCGILTPCHLVLFYWLNDLMVLAGHPLLRDWLGI